MIIKTKEINDLFEMLSDTCPSEYGLIDIKSKTELCGLECAKCWKQALENIKITKEV